jgi:hypothetical protein
LLVVAEDEEAEAQIGRREVSKKAEISLCDALVFSRAEGGREEGKSQTKNLGQSYC